MINRDDAHLVATGPWWAGVSLLGLVAHLTGRSMGEKWQLFVRSRGRGLCSGLLRSSFGNPSLLA